MLTKLVLTAAALSLTASLAAAQGTPGAQMIDQWDANADGTVALDEARAKRGEVFYMFDKNDDEALSAEEWAEVAAHLAAEEGEKGSGNGGGHGNGPGAAMHAAMTPEFNDLDADGTVSRTEFEAATDKLFAMLDKTGDGIVTVADFGRP